MTAIGARVVRDPTLSASGKIACSTCHDPSRVFVPQTICPCNTACRWKGTGVRALPSLRYLQSVPPFTEHFFEADGNDSEDQGRPAEEPGMAARNRPMTRPVCPVLGFRDGECQSRSGCREGPELAFTPGQLQDLFGKNIFDDPGAAFNDVLMALEGLSAETHRSSTLTTASTMRGCVNKPRSLRRKSGARTFQRSAQGKLCELPPEVPSRVVPFQPSPTTAISRWGYHAIQRSLLTRIPTTTIWVCADP